jgi:hypothetical protein
VGEPSGGVAAGEISGALRMKECKHTRVAEAQAGCALTVDMGGRCFASTCPPLSERSERFGGEARVQPSRASSRAGPARHLAQLLRERYLPGPSTSEHDANPGVGGHLLHQTSTLLAPLPSPNVLHVLLV